MFVTAGWIKMPLGTKVGLSPGDFVLDGDLAPLSKKGAEPHPQFSAHVYCDKTAGWINMALGVEVGLGPGHIVLDGDPAPLPQNCLLYTSPSPRDRQKSRMPSSA